ncbi:MAG: universal stress protein [Ectothiorhodospiraceae bacterium]|nr:universal stress protein [Ectothiorhodospiraceae bacterium]
MSTPSSANPIPRRILCAIDIRSRSRVVLDRARHRLQRANHGTPPRLAVATVIDYQPGFEVDHYPFLSPDELRRQTAQQLYSQLERMAAEVLDGLDVEVLVGIGPARATLIGIARRWRADLLFAGSHASFGLLAPAHRHPPLPFQYEVVDTRCSLLQRATGYLSPFIAATRSRYSVEF